MQNMEYVSGNQYILKIMLIYIEFKTKRGKNL